MPDGVLAAAATVVATTAVLVVDEQENDDNEQNPGAVIAAEQVTQAHSVHPLTVSYYVAVRWLVRENIQCIKGQ